ncbi:hypothetical protein J5A70_07475 [Prevotella nigrescens]|uniref:hypothetical protein n=1 Tax=Prevotella nigrescens TaxID=28133 RepID=UPI001BA9BDD8|nr:hypothetical protein [Prevotella nigrescens]QUB48826.1 hypothetical protein J5A70_07475 [Prevotella nigrescens]
MHMFNKVLSFYKEIQPKQCQFDEFKMMQVQRQPSSERVLKPQRSYGNRRFGVTANVASGLRQSSLRGYGNRRFGVTANVASGLRQTSLRGYGKCRFGTDKNICSLIQRKTMF